MSTVSVGSVALDIDPLDLPEILRPVVEQHRAEAEELRRTPPALVEALRAAGAFRLTTPRELGGFEAGLATTLRVFEGVGRLDGSLGWILWNGNLGFSAAFMSEAGADAIWSRNPDPVFANSTRPGNRAVKVDGGYELSGRWDIVSGVDTADWLALFAEVVHEPALEHPDILVFYTPKDSVEVHDTWNVAGMRGSGSNSVVVDRLFIPQDLTLSLAAPTRIDHPLYRIPMFTIVAPGGAAVLLGIAASAVDEIAALMPTKGTDTGVTLDKREFAQLALGRAQTQLDAARTLLLSACEDVDNAAAAADPITDKHRARVRAAMTYATEVSREVLTSMYELGGTSSLYIGRHIEQKFRDGFAGAQHAHFSTTYFAVAARIRLGLDPGVPVF